MYELSEADKVSIAAALNSGIIPATIEGYDAIATALVRDADNDGDPIVFDSTVFARRGSGDYHPDGPRPAGSEAKLIAERRIAEILQTLRGAGDDWMIAASELPEFVTIVEESDQEWPAVVLDGRWVEDSEQGARLAPAIVYRAERGWLAVGATAESKARRLKYTRSQD